MIYPPWNLVLGFRLSGASFFSQISMSPAQSIMAKLGMFIDCKQIMYCRKIRHGNMKHVLSFQVESFTKKSRPLKRAIFQWTVDHQMTRLHFWDNFMKLPKLPLYFQGVFKRNFAEKKWSPRITKRQLFPAGFPWHGRGGWAGPCKFPLGPTGCRWSPARVDRCRRGSDC